MEEYRAEADRLCIAESMHLAEKSQIEKAGFDNAAVGCHFESTETL